MERRPTMYWGKLMSASIVALGLSPGTKDRPMTSRLGASRSTSRTSTKRRSRAEHPVKANPPTKLDQQE